MQDDVGGLWREPARADLENAYHQLRGKEYIRYIYIVVGWVIWGGLKTFAKELQYCENIPWL